MTTSTHPQLGIARESGMREPATHTVADVEPRAPQMAALRDMGSFQLMRADAMHASRSSQVA